MPSDDWFEKLTGFREQDYELTQSRLAVEGDELVSTVNDRRYGVGILTLPTLAELLGRVKVLHASRTTVHCIAADVGALHADPDYEGVLFQVASQFNLLEMTGPSVSPEDGVARYAYDQTQGPACAIAAGAATIYRNYCVPVEDRIGQTRDHQLNALAHVGSTLAAKSDKSIDHFWSMQNGYALCTQAGLHTIDDLVQQGGHSLSDELRAALANGVHANVEITSGDRSPGQRLSQAFCSALPIAYSPIPRRYWETFARLILEASYEATLLVAVEQSSTGGSNTVLLTRVGGGAFGNADAWIDDAIMRALAIVEYAGLDVKLVSFGQIAGTMQTIADQWEGRG